MNITEWFSDIEAVFIFVIVVITDKGVDREGTRDKYTGS